MAATGTSGEPVAERPSELLDALQRAVLWRVAHGQKATQVARELAISEATMRRTIRRARVALGAVSTVHAVYLAAKGGLI
jgi:DNA-binding NarL/FixJ family response regulator